METVMNYAEAYGKLHQNDKHFAGYTLKRYSKDIAELVAAQQTRSILDYGCGKGYQYLQKRLHEDWGGLLPYCYDIGVRQLNERPTKKFDAVINTDMMEHIERVDVPTILDDILSFVTDEDRPTFAFFSIACRPADHKTLPDGRNVHVTIEPPEWWKKQLNKAADRRALKHLTIRAAFEDEKGLVIRDWK